MQYCIGTSHSVKYNLNLWYDVSAWGKVFLPLGQSVVKLLFLWIFSKISLGLTLLFALIENVFYIKLVFELLMVLKTSKASFLSFLISINGFTLNLKGALVDLRQFLTDKNPLKKMKNALYFIWKALFVLKIFKFLS